MPLRVILGTMAASLMLAGTATAAVNLVKDGKFTTAPDPGSFQTYTAIGPLGGWTVLSGSVDLIGSYWSAPHTGGRSVDLDGNSPGWLAQTITFPHSGEYQLTFQLSGNPDGLTTQNATKQLEVDIGTNSHDFSYTVTSASKTLPYTLETMTFFEGPSNSGPLSETLLFRSLDGINSPYGTVVGDVSITAVPEPATWAMMLIGFGGLGAALRMSRRRALVAA